MGVEFPPDQLCLAGDSRGRGGWLAETGRDGLKAGARSCGQDWTMCTEVLGLTTQPWVPKMAGMGPSGLSPDTKEPGTVWHLGADLSSGWVFPPPPAM